MGWWWGWLFLIQPPNTPPPKFKSYLWYPDIYVWVSGWGGGSTKMEKNFYRFKTECWASPTVSHIYDTLTFMFECQGLSGGGVVISHSTPPPPPHPWNLSHIYDTLTFMFECQGWGGGGSIKNGKKFTDSKLNVEHPKNLSHIYDTLDIYVWVLGVGVGSHHIYKINFNKYVILIKIIFHFYFFQNKAVPSANM